MKKSLNAYALVTQGIITIIVLLLIGYGIGYLIDKSSLWPGILAVVGGIIGIIYFIMTIIRMSGDESGNK